LIRDGRTIAARHGSVNAARSAAFAELDATLEDPPTVHRLHVEQSNTSVRFDSGLMLKLIRHIEPGINPDVELGQHLTDRVRFTHAPRFAGVVRHASATGEQSALAVLHEFVWSQGDAWSFTVGELRRYLENEAGVPFDGMSDDARPEPLFASQAAVIGARTAELHLALADARGEPAFVPEPFGAADARAVVTRIRARLRRVTPALRRFARGEPDDPLAEDARAILAIGRAAAGRLAIPAAALAGLKKIRCHGDYHLGQLLWTRGDFSIVDFEGEVGLPLAARRAKTSVFTDVAGMLRSFQYAAGVALREYAAGLPDPAAAERAAPWARFFEQRASDRFRDAYFSAAAGASFVPGDVETRRRLLSLSLLDKALHELEYEIDHRPDWVPIPLRGVATILRELERDGV